MKYLLQLSRVTFLYNICMLLTILMKYVALISAGSLQSTIIVSGLVLAIGCNAAVMISVIIMIMLHTSWNAFRPRWLFAVNFLFFLIQIYLLIT